MRPSAGQGRGGEDQASSWSLPCLEWCRDLGVGAGRPHGLMGAQRKIALSKQTSKLFDHAHMAYVLTATRNLCAGILMGSRDEPIVPPERTVDDLTTQYKIDSAKRAAQEALRAAVERRLIDGELSALEYYANECRKYSNSLEARLAGATERRNSTDKALDQLLGYPQDTSPVPMQVGLAPLVVRAADSLSSDKVCELAPGARVDVLEVCETSDGRRRARIAFTVPAGLLGLRQVTNEGWVTLAQPDGTEHLVPASFAGPSQPTLSATDRRARAACASLAALLQTSLPAREWHWHEERVGETGEIPISWLRQLEAGVKLLQAAAQREPALKLQLAEQRVRADAAEAMAEQRLRRLQQLEDELNYSEARETSLKVKLKELEDELDQIEAEGEAREAESEESEGEEGEGFPDDAYEDFGGAPGSGARA